VGCFFWRLLGMGVGSIDIWSEVFCIEDVEWSRLDRDEPFRQSSVVPFEGVEEVSSGTSLILVTNCALLDC
jgi:hypothetical protein